MVFVFNYSILKLQERSNRSETDRENRLENKQV